MKVMLLYCSYLHSQISSKKCIFKKTSLQSLFVRSAGMCQMFFFHKMHVLCVFIPFELHSLLYNEALHTLLHGAFLNHFVLLVCVGFQYMSSLGGFTERGSRPLRKVWSCTSVRLQKMSAFPWNCFHKTLECCEVPTLMSLLFGSLNF